MNEKQIPAQFRYQIFQPTGGVWMINDDHIVELVLGPRVEEHRNVVAEAHWVKNLYTRLEMLDRTQAWNAVVSLHRQPAHPNPPLEMRAVFASILKDPQTHRVGLVNFTGWQKRIIEIYIVTTGTKHKLSFFPTTNQARRWILEVE